MSFEPEKFFIGLMDFFSILLPGAILTFFLQNHVGGRLFDAARYTPKPGPESWVLFLFSSYLLGHFIFLLGSPLDSLYDRFRNATDRGQIARLADGKRLSPELLRWGANEYFRTDDAALAEARRIKDRYIDPARVSSAINTFQWCKARLLLEQPAMMASVQRFEADSKFFRSLIIVLAILIAWGALRSQPVLVVAGVAGIVPAIWRYVDQRKKSIKQAYWYVMTIEASQGEAPASQPAERRLPLLRAGGIVFRKKSAGYEYLLVQATKSPNEWVLPKGHVEPGERTQETAVREVREEAGVWARVMADLGVVTYEVDEPVKVHSYLMEKLEQGKPKEKRKHKWVSLTAAERLTLYPETADLLKRANEILTRPHEV